MAKKKKRPGRPKGSKNKATQIKKKGKQRGRPAGTGRPSSGVSFYTERIQQLSDEKGQLKKYLSGIDKQISILRYLERNQP